MGININSFSKDKNSVEVTENLPTAVQEENFDIMEYTNNKKNELRKSKEVEALTSLIEVENPDTILQFGRKASEGVARVSDSLLNTIKLNRNEENSKMLVHLTKIMDK
ncbi:TPA: toxic anion resistance protein, partial [Clostridioides difficile]